MCLYTGMGYEWCKGLIFSWFNFTLNEAEQSLEQSTSWANLYLRPGPLWLWKDEESRFRGLTFSRWIPIFLFFPLLLDADVWGFVFLYIYILSNSFYTVRPWEIGRESWSNQSSGLLCIQGQERWKFCLKIFS